MQLFDLGHQRFVNGQAASGVDQQHVEEMALGVVDGGACNIDWFLVGRAGEPLGPGLRCHSFELLNGSGAVHITRNREHFFLAFFNQVFGQLGGGGGFTRTLQARHQDHGGRLRSQIDVAHALTHRRGEFFADDTDQHLAGLQRAHDFRAESFVFDARNKVAHHGQGHVGFEQGHAHLTQHVLYVGLGDAGLAAHFFDQSSEFVGKG